MNKNTLFSRPGLFRKSIFALVVAALTGVPAQATIVQFETNMGNFEVNLYDNATPQTVANFLQYVNGGDYTQNIMHRSIPGFILQGGGFKYQSSWPVTAIEANAPVINEPTYSNVRGTIAMAKLGSNPDSATSQWFFNLADNSLNLDRQNSGFTVFGEVTDDGMAIIDQIAALDRFNFGGALTDLPLQNFTSNGDPDDTNLIIIQSIQVIDATVDTAAGLNPPANIGPADLPEPPSSSSGGGGSLGLLLVLLGGLLRRRACY